SGANTPGTTKAYQILLRLVYGDIACLCSHFHQWGVTTRQPNASDCPANLLNYKRISRALWCVLNALHSRLMPVFLLRLSNRRVVPRIKESKCSKDCTCRACGIRVIQQFRLTAGREHLTHTLNAT